MQLDVAHRTRIVGGSPTLSMAGRIAIILVVMALACRALSVIVPIFDWDEYAFGLSGHSILTGHLPSVGIFDNKPVGLVYVFALAEGALGETVAALRIVGFGAATFTAFMICRTAARFGAARDTGLVSAALFLALVFSYGGWASMSELVACAPLALANELIMRRNWRDPRLLLAFGAVGGIAFQISYLTLPAFALMGLALLIANRSPWAIMRGGVLGVLGFSVTVLALWMPQIIAGTFPTYVAEQLRYTSTYRTPWFGVVHYLWVVVRISWLAILPLALVLAAVLRNGVPKAMLSRDCLAVSMGLIGSLLAATASNHFFPHYFLLTLPSISLLLAMLMTAETAPRVRAGMIASVLAVSVILIAQSALRLERRIEGPPAAAMSQRDAAGTSDSDLEVRAARLVDRLTLPGQPIFVFDESPAIYYLANREPVTRYVFTSHYIADHPMVPARVLLTEVVRRRPALLVVGNLSPAGFDADDMVKSANYHAAGHLALGDRIMTIYIR